MDSNKIKATLKEARDSIKKKDFKGAIKLCKAVLTSDRSNYNGLVLFGVALQETEQKEQAEKAFKKAINVSPNQILAYQGLASYYEKIENRTKEQNEELINVYKQFLLLESDVSKFTENISKLSSLCQSTYTTDECIKLLLDLKYEDREEYHRISKKSILNFMLQVKELSPEYEEMMDSSLTTFVKDKSNTKEETLEYYKKYFKLLYKSKKLQVLLNEAKDLLASMPNVEFALEWLCKVCSEEIAINKVSTLSASEVTEFFNQLLALSPTSSLATLAKAAVLFQERSFYESSQLLKEVGKSLPQTVYVWVLLSDCCMQMHSFQNAVSYASKACSMLLKQSPVNTALIKSQTIIWAKSLSFQRTEESMKEAATKCHEFLETYNDDPEIMIILAKSYIYSGNSRQMVYGIMEDHETNRDFTGSQSALLQSLYLASEHKLDNAINVLSSALTKDPNDIDLLLELGQLYSQLNQHQESLQTFLKAAKVAPHCASCFIYLGQEYQNDGKDTDKARRCFLKALQLNANSIPAGLGLADIYKTMGNEDGYLQLLRNVSQQGGGGAKWAWMRLGTHELQKRNYEEAINAIRAAIRADPSDSYCWETLGDAYSGRGSYISALKSYMRARELEPEGLYPLLQRASIKHMLGFYEESAELFKIILMEDPDYVPALKGLGETYLCIARSFHAKQLLGSCRDYCQLSLETLSTAANVRHDLSCIWKLLGDICLMVFHLPDNRAFLNVPLSLLENSDDKNSLFNKQKLLELGARCYCRALALGQDVGSLLWQDLAVDYHLQADISTNLQAKLQLQEWALAAAKKSVSIDSNRWQHWNILGIIAASQELRNYRLAQHAFIKSICADSKNAIPWTNLGTLYLSLGNMKLANKSFKMAQRKDPSYIQSWIGQALIAEATGHDDAMDLFRHTTELGVHPESCIGYANWVCATLQHSETQKHTQDYNYVIEKMQALPIAADSMTWYTGKISTNACAYNMLGILMERLGLNNSAAQAFKTSLGLLESMPNTDKLADLVRTNYGRILVELKCYDEAIQQYKCMKEPNFTMQCGLALAYFKAEMYEESHSSYESALHWLAPNDGLKSHILVAMAAMAYMFQGVEDSQTLLYQCITLKPPSVQGLFAACSLGMLHSDLNLSELVLKELEPHRDNPNYMTDIAIFKSYTFYLQNQTVEAVRALSACVHRHPGQASLWLALALLLLHDNTHQNAVAAGRSAQIAMALGRGSMDVSKVMSVVSLSNLLTGKGKASLRSSQKAVHMYPDVTENWVSLIASHLPRCMTDNSVEEAVWLGGIIDHAKSNTNVSRQVGKWLKNCEKVVVELIECNGQ